MERSKVRCSSRDDGEGRRSTAPKYGGRDGRLERWGYMVDMPSRSTGHRLWYSWDDVAGTAHQMMARARRDREVYSWTSRSIGVSNGRHVLDEGACRAWGVGVRYVAILCARERQHPGRAPRVWGRALERVGASTWSSLGVSITGGITLLLVPACFPSGMEVASYGHASPQRLVTSRRGNPVCVRSS
jgi:hypothetical protein